MKKRIFSALLLACALVIAPVGNIFSTVVTASDDSGQRANTVYTRTYQKIFAVSSGRMTVAEAMQQISEIYTAEELQYYKGNYPVIAAVFKQLEIMMDEAGVEETASSEVEQISSVRVSGAMLNAAPDSTKVELTVKAPAETASIDLANPAAPVLQMDISLAGVADSHKLMYPVEITIPVPAGFSTDSMHIRHYVNGINADYAVVPFTAANGEITFSTTSFSLFVLVGEPAPENPEKPSDQDADNADNDNDDDSSDESETAAPETQGVKDSVPKTGDSTVPVLPFAAAGAACAAAAVILKKKEQA